MSSNPFKTEGGFVLYHTIEISIGIKEEDLTDKQRKTCEEADTNLQIDHPVELGCETLTDHIENVAAAHFSYLGDGSKAVKVCIDNGLLM